MIDRNIENIIYDLYNIGKNKSSNASVSFEFQPKGNLSALVASLGRISNITHWHLLLLRIIPDQILVNRSSTFSGLVE